MGQDFKRSDEKDGHKLGRALGPLSRGSGHCASWEWILTQCQLGGYGRLGVGKKKSKDYHPHTVYCVVSSAYSNDELPARAGVSWVWRLASLRRPRLWPGRSATLSSARTEQETGCHRTDSTHHLSALVATTTHSDVCVQYFALRGQALAKHRISPYDSTVVGLLGESRDVGEGQNLGALEPWNLVMARAWLTGSPGKQNPIDPPLMEILEASIPDEILPP